MKILITIEDDKLRIIPFNKTIYQSAIGNLLYLAICTRPGILFAVNKAARKSKDPNMMEDWESVIKIFKHLKYTMNYGLHFSKNNIIKIFTDADYAGDKTTRKSTSGFIIKIGDSQPVGFPISNIVSQLPPLKPNITVLVNVLSMPCGTKI